MLLLPPWPQEINEFIPLNGLIIRDLLEHFPILAWNLREWWGLS
jgi:hypothetical protein